MTYYTEDAFQEDVPIVENRRVPPSHGREMIREFLVSMFEDMPDLGFEFVSASSAGDRMVVEWIMTGTQYRDFSGRFSIRGVSVIKLREDKIASEARIVYLAKLFEEAEYGRHLCVALAEASALKDLRLVLGLMKVAAYHVDDKDYDCRPKWIAIAALARHESPDATPLLVSLVDHGNQNTRFWARAALARMAREDFKADKQAWNKWWMDQGHNAIDAKLLEPYTPLGSK